MKYLFFFLAINLTFSQTSVFDCARTGTVEEMQAFYTTNPKLIEALNDRGSSPLTRRGARLLSCKVWQMMRLKEA